MNTRRIGLILAALLLAFFAVLYAAGQKNDQAELQLKAAMNKELVDGDLKGAIEIYQKIISGYSNNRPVVAQALVQMGQCYEKLGRAEARGAYERVLREFAEQAEPSRLARQRLAALAGTASLTAGADITIRRVWSGSRVETNGSPSPDGRYLSISDLAPGSAGELAVLEIASGRMRRLTNKAMLMGSKWSPDGGRIAYMDWMSYPELKIIGSDGSGVATLAWGEPLDWSPDGRFILAIDYRNHPKSSETLALVSVADGSFTVLGTSENRISSQSAGFSADGKYIVYDIKQQKEASERDIYIIPIDGKQGMPLVKHPANDWLLGWAPGSEIVLFASDRSGTRDAWAVRVADGKPQGEPVLIRKEIGPIIRIGFAREGSFYYAHPVTTMDVYESSLDLAKGMVVEPPQKVIRPVEGINFNAEWSPDGKYLAFVSMHEAGSASWNSYVVCIRSEQTGEVREVTPPIRSPYFGIHWSADGRAVFASIEDKTIRGLFKIDIQTGKHALVVQVDYFTNLFRDFTVSQDGKSIYYVIDPPPERRAIIVRHDLETGQEEEVYRPAPRERIFPIALSPDGKYLAIGIGAFGMGASGVIRIMPTGGGETRDLPQGKPEGRFGPFAWTPDGKSILFVKRTTGTEEFIQELWQVDLAGGEPRKINLGMEPRTINIHPDGKRIAFTTLQNITEIWVMENFLQALKSAR